MQLLPADFDSELSHAVQHFWTTRAVSGVRAGKTLARFGDLLTRLAQHLDLGNLQIWTSGDKNLTIPGYYRPTKRWDALIVHDHRLIVALELKSQVGSLGNNFNNRAEEVIGSGYDMRLAEQHGLYLPSNATTPPPPTATPADPRPPFLGYLMLLEDTEAAHSGGQATSTQHFNVDRAFHDTAYVDRYRVLCDRLMMQRVYDAAALLLSPPDAGLTQGAHRSITEATSAENLFRAIASRMLIAA